MAKQIAGVYERVMKCAKKEFLEKGYVDASLREIAKAAATSTGSIYTRFHDKEGLFQALVEPVLEEMKEMYHNIEETFHQIDREQQENMMEDYAGEGMHQLVNFMYAHFDEFCLLLDASYGTRFQNFVDELVDIEVEYTYQYMDVIHCGAVKSGRVPKEFLHITTSGYLGAVFEVIRHRMKKEEALHYVDLLQKYHRAGYHSIYCHGDEVPV